MKIDATLIMKSENKECLKEIPIEMEAFTSKLGIFPITKKPPLLLKMANHEGREISVSGSVELELKIPCGRCLTDVSTLIHFDIDRVLKVDENRLVDEEMEENDYLIGFELDVERLVYAEILVNWPVKVLCREDCRGICKVCGKNLNKGDCRCQRTEPDPRMAAIQDVFSKFKEV